MARSSYTVDGSSMLAAAHRRSYYHDPVLMAAVDNGDGPMDLDALKGRSGEARAINPLLP
jgi:hypothetical protein